MGLSKVLDLVEAVDQVFDGTERLVGHPGRTLDHFRVQEESLIQGFALHDHSEDVTSEDKDSLTIFF